MRYFLPAMLLILMSQNTYAANPTQIESAQTEEAATAAYQTEAQTTINQAEQSGVPQTEIERAAQKVKDNIKSATQKSSTDNSAAEDTTDDEKIKALEDNAQAMRDKERSFENRMLGAAGIASVGIGGMQAMSGLAEQRADETAEENMRAYLETFRCKYNDGPQYKIGDVNIELPISDGLFDLYQEYTTLAQNLKTTKDSLGLRPGIEAEQIIDKSSTGLYSNAGTGITGGGYASIARAILNPAGEDAARWQKQVDAAKSKTKTGATIAAVGAVATMATNLAINSRKARQDKASEINKQLESQVKQLEQEIAGLKNQTNNTQCPAGATGTHPNCTCTGAQTYNANNNTCDAAETPAETTPSSKCNTNNPNMVVGTNDTCNCKNGYMLSNNNTDCECPAGTHILLSNGNCSDKSELFTAELTADTMFELGKADLKDDAKNKIQDYITNITPTLNDTNSIEANDICMTITGHTDKTGNNTVNDNLSKQRANAVKTFITGINNQTLFTTTNIQTVGKGSAECSTDGNQPTCRRVSISAKYESCSTN